MEQKSNIAEIYDKTFVEKYSIITHIINVISIVLSLALIYAIKTQTPKAMNGLKIYLLLFSFHTILGEIVFGLSVPVLLHPFTFIYPAGFAETFSPNISLLLISFAALTAFNLLVCSFSITLMRYFALKSMEDVGNRKISKIPLYLFLFLSIVSFCLFLAWVLIIFIQPLRDIFLIPIENLPTFVELNFENVEKSSLNLKNIIIFNGSTKKGNFPSPVIFIHVFLAFICFTSVIIHILNAIKSHKLKDKMSKIHQKSNSILLRISYFQFLGFITFLIFPVSFTGFLYITQTSSPTSNVNYCLAGFAVFGLYDSIMTFICIKPYRIYFLSFFRNFFYKPRNTVIVPSVVLVK